MSVRHGAVTSEKRVHPRAAIELVVSCERRGAPAIAGTARDIGLGGIFVESSESLAFGTEVVIVTHLGGTGAPVRLPGVVRWTKVNGFGVQFGLLGARETHLISLLFKR